jgi:hypothetical protein
MRAVQWDQQRYVHTKGVFVRCIVNGINKVVNLTSVFDNACLVFLEMPKLSASATAYGGIISAVA